MGFVRVKRSKKKDGNLVEYAYIVENRRAWGKVKQKSKKYLGRVYRYEPINVAEFYEFHSIIPEEVEDYFNNNSVKDILIDLIEVELYKHGFTKVEGKKWLWQNNGIFVDLRENKFYSSRGIAALGFNNGYLCQHYVSKLMNFRIDSEEDAVKLAKTLVEAGLDVPKEIYVGIFNKLSLGKELFEYED
jgi:hypothetical protein